MARDAAEEAFARAAPPGSSLDCALRTAPRAARGDLLAVAAYAGELRRIPAEASEPGVARSRLQWWRTEHLRILDGGGEHPIASALAAAVERHALPGAELRALLDEADRTLDAQPPATLAEQRDEARRLGAAPQRLAARILCGPDTGAQAYAERAGAAAVLTRRLRLQGLAARRGQLQLPIAALEAQGLAPGHALADRSAEGQQRLQAAVAAHAGELAGLYRQAAEHAPREAALRRRLRPLAAYTAIHRALLEEIRRRPERLLAGRITLTPLRKAWLARRARLAKPPRLLALLGVA